MDENAVAWLAEGATRRHIRYMYPFATYLRTDGSFSPSYSHAAEFVSAFRRHNQGVYLLAWIGIPLVNDRALGIQGTVNLANEATRERIVEFIVELLDEADFDGIHLDVETVRSGDPDYLLLLEEVRAAIDTKQILSIAGSYWVPESLNRLPGVEGIKWNESYYQAVASRVDQIAVMTYDSVMPYSALYRLWLREQVRGIEQCLTGSGVELLFGVSVSREETFTHHPGAENMRNGLAGICAGLAYTEGEPMANGVAVYAAWEAEASDWAELWKLLLE